MPHPAGARVPNLAVKAEVGLAGSRSRGYHGAMLLGAFLLIGALPATSLQDAPARSEILSDTRQFLTGIDADGDGSLSLAEWTGRVGKPDPARPRSDSETSNPSELRTYLIEEHRRTDRDRDGQVTLDELIREPLASFDCMDGDRDLRLSEREIRSGRKICPSGPAVRIVLSAEPPADATPDR